MKETITALLKQNSNNRFLKNRIKLKCEKCGFCETITYYDFLSRAEYEIGQTSQTVSPFISESIYDETIHVTPLTLNRKCPICHEEIKIVFPISIETLIPMLQSRPPDPQMYG